MLALLTGLTLLTAVGCTRQIEGSALSDPIKPLTQVSEDGFGIHAGFDEAPVQIEIFAEPQCTHCAHLQATFGEDIKRHIESGQLAVTYRPMTFLDDEYGIDYSAVVANALFLTVEPSTKAATFQNFVEDLWANQDLSFTDYTDDDFADIARDSGLSDDIIARISDGDSALDTDKLASANETLMSDESPESPGTPVVYNLKRKETIDISDPAWLDHLLQVV